jgi:hypothetical protein
MDKQPVCTGNVRKCQDMSVKHVHKFCPQDPLGGHENVASVDICGRGSSPKNTKFSNGTYTQKNLSELLNVLT